MKSSLTLFVIALGVAVLVSGCGKKSETAQSPAPQAQAPAAAPAEVLAQPVAYYYYPDVEVYYHPEARIYWWVDAGAWVSGPRPPSTIVLRDNARVMVNLNVAQPWRQHETVLRQHPRPGRRQP
jgi:hypothetical protein